MLVLSIARKTPFGCTTALPYFCCCVVVSKCAMQAMLGQAACKHLWEAADSDATGIPCLFLRSVSSGNGVGQMLLAAGHSWPHSWALCAHHPFEWQQQSACHCPEFTALLHFLHGRAHLFLGILLLPCNSLLWAEASCSCAVPPNLLALQAAVSGRSTLPCRR